VDWDHLRIFLAVARSGQVLGAARKLGLNHATVARKLDALEDQAGAVLFDRRPSGTTLTDAGEILLPIAERIETEVTAAAEALAAETAGVSGTVRIGAPDGLGNMFLAAELGSLSRQHPDLVVELVPLPRAFSLSRREADIAIVLDRPAEGRLVISKLTDYTLGVYAARSYLAEHGTPRGVGDLSAHTVVAGVDDYAYASALDYAAALGGSARSVFRCASVVGQMAAIRAGVGVGILHDFAAVGMADLVRILPEVAFRRSYYMLSHPDTHAIRRIAACRSFVSRRFREERSRFLPGSADAEAPGGGTESRAACYEPARATGRKPDGCQAEEP
jgi:DNA-binding transcriptional LysR family regulator